MNYAKGGLASLKAKADQLEKAGRKPDTTLVHMTPEEVDALRKIAIEQYGMDLPRNPKTGLYEAGIMSSLLGLAGGFVGIPPWLTAAALGGGTLLSGGSSKDALMNAIGGYGGASMAGALGGAAAQGAAAAGVEGASEAALAANPALAETAAQEAAKKAAAEQVASSAVVPPSAPISDSMLAQNTNALNDAYLRAQAPVASIGDATGVAADVPASTLNNSALDTVNNRIREARMLQVEPTSTLPSAAPTNGYADLSLWDKTKYAGEHIGKDPWKFFSKEVGMGPSTIMAHSVMEAMNNPPEVSKRPSSFYQYDYDPDTGTFKNERKSSAPYWKAASGGLAAAARYADGGDIVYTPEPNEPSLMEQWLRLVRGDKYNGKAAGGLAALAGGRRLQGPGDGVSDSIPAMIDGQQHAALSTDEYVIPARVVAELGNGSSTAGAKKLDAMLSRVEAAARKVKRGKNSNADRYLPA